jgi:hypothetical protein
MGLWTQVALKASQRSAAAAQANAELQGKLREMENSLRQATKDYQLILQGAHAPASNTEG